MAYTVRNDATNMIVYDPRIDNAVLVDPVLHQKANTFGSFKCKMHSNHTDFGSLQKRRTIYSIYKDDASNPLWKGILVSGDDNLNPSIDLYFEDFMSVLRDSMQDAFVFTGQPVAFLALLIDEHNAQVQPWQRVTLGYVTVTDPNDYVRRSSESELSTWDAIKTRLIDTLGGYVRMRYEGGVAYLDYLKGDTNNTDPRLNTSTQIIEFGENLKEFSRVVNAANTYTACIPKGAQVDHYDDEGELHSVALTIESVNDGSKYLIDTDAVALYGFRCAPISETTWSDVTVPSNLKTKGLEWLQGKGVKLSNTIKLSALDLRHLGVVTDSYGFLDYIRVSIYPYSIDAIYLLTELSIPLDDPSELSIGLGETTRSLADLQRMQMANAQKWINSVSETVNKTQSANSHAVSTVDIEYYLSDSPTTLSGGEWLTVAPEWVNGKYMWSRVKKTTIGGVVTTSDPTCIAGATGATGAQGPQGVQGPQGEQGVQGPAGTSGKTTYFHVKYAPVQTPTSAQMTETPSTYIGTYVDYSEADSTDPTKYTWARFQGLQGPTGEQGIPGTDGVNGQTSYLHIKYSDDGGSTFTANNGETPGEWIGQYVDYTSDDSTVTSDYKWAKIKGDRGPQGIQGPTGANGQTLYTWLKYADTPTSGMSENPAGKTYIGLAYNKTTSTESSNYSDYTWSLIKGEDGKDGAQGLQGVPGPAGTDGQTLYTWIRYADDASGSGMSQYPDDKKYIGLAYNKTTPNESDVTSDYTWSLIKGEDGAKGDQGVGLSEVQEQYYLSTSSTTPTGGSWVDTAPTWSEGLYIWYRSKITYTNGDVAYTTEFYDPVSTSANDKASDAKDTAESTKKDLDDYKDIVTEEQEGIRNEIAETSSEIQTIIEQMGDRILTQVSEIYTSTTSFEEFQSQVSTMLTQTSDAFELQFSTITSRITNLDGSVSSRFSEISKYIRFVDGNIILGEDGNPLILKITNERISFLHNNVEIAYFSSGRLFVNQIEAITSFTLGDFAFGKDSSGGMNIKYIGA